MDFVKMTLANINTSYKTTMTESDLLKFMLSGEIEKGFEGQVMHLLDETPTSVISGAVEQVSKEKNIDAKQIWETLANVAADIKSPNTFWVELQNGQKL